MSIKNSIHLMHPQTQSQHFSLARGLASLGRGSDTNLVHMSDKEINGLKTLAAKSGGSLTVNPHTGLYEAGWLENILPMVAGAALSFTGVGAPAAALMVAAADTAATKDWKSGLAAGLGAFGGAGVGAGLAGAGASAAGADSAVIGSDVAGTAASGAASGATDAAGVAAGSSPVAAGTSAAADTAAPAAVDTAIPSSLASTPSGLTPGVAQSTQAAVNAPIASDVSAGSAPTSPLAVEGTSAGQQANLAQNSFSQNAANAGKGLGQFASNPGQTASDVYASTGKLGLAGLAAPAAYANYKQSQIPTPNQPYKYYNTTYNQGNRNPYAGELGQDPIVGQGYTSPTSSMYTPITFAAGGPVPNIHPIQQPPAPTPAPPPVPGQGASQADQIAYYRNLVNTPSNQVSAPPPPNAQQQYLQQLQQQIQGSAPAPTSMGGTGSPPPKATTQPVNSGQGYNPATQSYSGLTSYNLGNGAGAGAVEKGYQYPVQSLARGGIASLGHYSDGGQLLRGPGDGMSDSIPAQIGNQKAALADGEFVVSGDVVSGLGNGSTEAGSRKLYAMMDRVRKARTGKSSQPGAINANKMLPG